MSDVVPTQAVIVEGRVSLVTIGEAVSFGQVLKWDTTVGQFTLAFARGVLADSVVSYLALEAGIKDATIQVLHPGGVVDLGNALSIASPYFLSATPGNLAGDFKNDLVAGDYVSSLGIARTASELIFSVLNSRTPL